MRETPFLFVAVMLTVAASPQLEAGVFLQTITLAEQRQASGNDTAPFDFMFVGLDPVAASATSFTLDFSFSELDLNTDNTDETLSIIIDPNNAHTNLGVFPVTVTATHNSYNTSGIGQRIVTFAEIGGIGNFTDPFHVQLLPTAEVESRFNTNGSATLTLSYETASAVPEPSSLFLFSMAIPALCYLRRRGSNPQTGIRV